MKNLHKFLIVLISVMFIGSGMIAQNAEMAPKLKDQLEKPAKVKKTTGDLQLIGGSAEAAPSPYENAVMPGDDRSIESAFFPRDRDINAKASVIPSSTDDLFDLQFEWPVGVGGGEAGLETDGNYIYTSKWNGTGEFYRYEMDGTYLEQITVAGSAGCRDIAYNGTYFYGGAASTTIFEMDLANATMISTFTAPTDCRAIAYNEDDDVFYGNNWGSDITMFDASGANLGSWSVGPVGDSYYGFAYQGASYCGDGPFLWGAAQVGTNLNTLVQMELPSGAETGVTFDCGTVLSGVDLAGGLAIDDNLVSGYWTILGTSQNLNIFGLELCPSGPPPTVDIGVQAITEPSSGVNLGNAEAVTITVKNYGTDAVSSFDVSYSVDGGTPVVESVSTTLNGGDTYTHTFATTEDLSAYGIYAFEACTDLTGDENPDNDCKTKNVENAEPSLCAPVYSSGCVVGDGFSGFAVEEIQNLNNGCEDNMATGWSQYYGLGPAILLPGVEHIFQMETGYSSQHANIWIDYNDDLLLTADELIIQDFVLEAAGVLYDVPITIPATATPGEHVMRVMAVWLSEPTDPCGSYSYGEAEDYKVFIGVAEYGILEGTVTENTGGAPVDGAMVSVNNGTYTTTTASDGTYEILDVLVGDWPVDVTGTGYNPTSATVTITNGGTTVQDFAMTAPTMDITPTAINITIDPNTQTTEMVDIANNGDGLLGWSGQLEILTDDTKDLFDLIWEVPVGVGGGEAGIETDGVNIYTTKWNGTGEFYRYDMDGTYIEVITVAGAVGIRDLAYDGTYFYGSAATTTVFEVDLTNLTLVSSFTAPTAVRAIAYNENDDAFYANNWGTDITKFDKTGATMGSFPVGPVGDSYYGFAFDNYSPGAPYLWGYAQVGTSLSELIQIQLPAGTETGVTFDVGSVLSAVDLAGGLAIDNNIASGLWAFLGTCQNINLWALELAPGGAGGNWISIDPTSGSVDPGNMDQVTVSFDATDIIPGTVKTANINFSSDPDVGMVTVPVSMTVGDLLFGNITGNVMLDGIAPYNYEDVTNVLVEAGPYSAYPDVNGDYDITAYPGTYDVTATLYGYTTQTTTGIVVTEGGTVSGIDFTMPCVIGKLYGTVTDVDDGSPIENAVVDVDGTDMSTTTAADGTYEFFIEAGLYDLTCTHPTYTIGLATDVTVPVQGDIMQDFELEYSCDYCDATTNTEDEWIMDVVCGDIQNLGTPWQGGIADYTDQFTVIFPGFSEDIAIENGNAWASDIVYVWVDWNMDCEFTPGGEEEFQLENVGGTGQTFTGQITAPVNAPEGMVRMRVRMTYSTPPEPCGNASYGEIEEYSLLVGAGTFGELEGYVTELGSGDPIDGAQIDVAGLYTTTSGSDGYYYFDEVFTGTWDVTASATGYNSETESVTIVENQLTTQDFELGAPDFNVTPTSVTEVLEPNEQSQQQVTIENPGNGTVDWSAQLSIISDNGTEEMFDLIWEVPVGVGGGEAGIETDGVNIYTTKWNGAGEFYRYGMDGTYIEVFTVSGAVAIRDLAYDGTYFYGGAASNTVFEVDLATGTLVSSFTAPTACRAIAYNENDDAFYANNWGTEITKFDKSGANLGSFPVGPVGDSYYGFAYDGYSDGAPYLWGYAQVGTNLNELVQIQLPDGTETGLTFDVASLLSANDIAGGLAIDDHISPGLWAFLGTCQNVNLWTLELGPAGPVWISIDPTSGTLAGGANETMNLDFDATELLPGIYEAEITFTTSPDVGSPVVDIELTVEGLIPAVNLNANFNCTDVELSWEVPTGGAPDSFNVYKDGTLMGNTTDMMYTDEMVDPDVEYCYEITAVYGGDESQPTPETCITVPVPADLDASGLEAMIDTPNENDVTLEWDAPACCVAPDGYNIYRDGVMANTALVTETTYVDEALTQGFYEYYVVAVYYFGESDASSPAYALITGVEELNATAFQIFPNPASEIVNVRSDYTVNSYELLNNVGQVVSTGQVDATSFTVNVADYERGIYYLRMTTQEGVALQKIAID